ncbi:MAG: potassium channel protein [Candidatus Bathyarchaeota archaeon]|nr:potassium channel protein [Candidatus Bathyarchaeota archaeon]MDH5687740.1 potassium channel protein [Candidatus Bathyarchaeota archaeon]
MVELEKIEYKPISIRELLVEIKDLSELMIDLAYSAALFNSHELAEDVLDLEKHVDTLAYMLNMNLMIAARDAEDAEALLGVSTVSSSANKISDAAADIATIVLQGLGIHPIIREAFERVEEPLLRVRIDPNSILVGKTLEELDLASKIGIDVLAIRRRNEWLLNPEEDERINGEDVVITRGAPAGLEKFEKIAKGEVRKLED